MAQQAHVDGKQVVEVAAEKGVEPVRGPVLLESPMHFQHLGMTGYVHLLVHSGRHDGFRHLRHPLKHHGSGNEVRTCHLLVHFPSSGFPAGPLDASWAGRTD